MTKKFFLSFLVLILGLKLINENLGCIGVGVFIGVVGIIIFLQLMFFKSELEKWICSTYFKDGSIFKKICLSKIIYRIFAFIFSIFLAFSLFSFMYLADIYSLIFVFIDGVIIYFLYNILYRSSANHLQNNLQTLFIEIGINVMNSLIFIIIILISSYYHRLDIAPDINIISSYVHDHIYHSCQYFKWYIRTSAIINYFIDSILNINFISYQIRLYLYFLFTITSISLFPAVALSLYYKWFLRKSKKVEK